MGQTKKDYDTVLRDARVFNFYKRVDLESCGEAMKWVLAENIYSSKNPMTMLVTSYGGLLDPCFGLIDLMLTSKAPITTVAVGGIYSAGFLILLAGKRRLVTSGTSMMCHQLSGGLYDKYHDVIAEAEQHKRQHERMVKYIASRTKLTTRVVRDVLLGPTNKYISPSEAVKMGIAHEVIRGLPV